MPKNKSNNNAKQVNKIPISMDLLRQNDIYERLKFAYAVSPRNTVRAFKKVGVVINGPEDLELLAELHREGLDVSGFTGRNGEVYAFNVEEILNRSKDHPNSIRVTRRMVSEAPIEWTDVIIHNGKPKIITP